MEGALVFAKSANRGQWKIDSRLTPMEGDHNSVTESYGGRGREVNFDRNTTPPSPQAMNNDRFLSQCFMPLSMIEC